MEHTPMLLTFFAAILGFAGGALPDIFKWLSARQDNSHELAMMGMQIKYTRLIGQQRIEEIKSGGDIMDSITLADRMKPSGNPWVDAFSATVRPVFTYLFYATYAVVKIAQYQIITNVSGIAWSEALNILWTEGDSALFATIVCFWFGSKNAQRARGGQ